MTIYDLLSAMNFTSGKSPTSLVDFPGLSFYYLLFIYCMLVGGLEPWNCMTFHSVGNVIIPTDELIFSEGMKPPTSHIVGGFTH